MCSFVTENTTAFNFQAGRLNLCRSQSRRLFLLENTATARSKDRCLSHLPSSTRQRTSTAFQNSLDPWPPSRRLPHLLPSRPTRVPSRTQWLPSQSLLRQRRSTLCSRVRPLFLQPPADQRSCHPIADPRLEHSVPPVARDPPDAHQVSDFGILVVRLSCTG